MADELITPFLHSNLQGLLGEEERIRTESVLCINANHAFKDHVEIIHSCLDVLYASHLSANSPLSDSDQVIFGLGVRLFNSGSCFLKLLLSGYYQGAVAFLRDIVEVGFLLDYFDHRPESIAAWRKGETNEFKPVNIRRVLDERDGFEEKGRAERYKFLSNYGTHASFKGFYLISSEKGLTIGPFMSEKLLGGIVEDGALHFPHSVLTCLCHHNHRSHNELKQNIGFLTSLEEWSVKYRGVKIVNPNLEELKKLFGYV